MQNFRRIQYNLHEEESLHAFHCVMAVTEACGLNTGTTRGKSVWHLHFIYFSWYMGMCSELFGVRYEKLGSQSTENHGRCTPGSQCISMSVSVNTSGLKIHRVLYIYIFYILRIRNEGNLTHCSHVEATNLGDSHHTVKSMQALFLMQFVLDSPEILHVLFITCS